MNAATTLSIMFAFDALNLSFNGEYEMNISIKHTTRNQCSGQCNYRKDAEQIDDTQRGKEHT